MSDKIVVLSTCGSAEEAASIARALVERRLAACVNIVPEVRSIYRWKGAVEEAGEWLLIVKSSQALFERLEEELRRMHSTRRRRSWPCRWLRVRPATWSGSARSSRDYSPKPTHARMGDRVCVALAVITYIDRCAFPRPHPAYGTTWD